MLNDEERQLVLDILRDAKIHLQNHIAQAGELYCTDPAGRDHHADQAAGYLKRRNLLSSAMNKIKGAANDTA